MRSWREVPGCLALAAWLAVSMAIGCGTDAEGDDTADAMSGPSDAGSSDGGRWSSLGERPCPEDSILTYENFGAAFLSSWCNGCHGAGRGEGQRQGAPLGVDFDTLEDIRRQADRIWARAADANDSMPPVGGPPASLRAQLGEWLACGAP